MRRMLIIVLSCSASIAQAQLRPLWPGFTCNHEPLRTTLISGAIGGVAVPGLALLRDSDHRIDPSERLIYFWGFTAGSSVSAAVGHMLAAERCPSPRVPPDSTRACAGASLRGAMAGGFFGGVAAFDISPILMLPAALGSAIGGRHFNSDHAMGLIAAGGAALGMSLGAHIGYHGCSGY